MTACRGDPAAIEPGPIYPIPSHPPRPNKGTGGGKRVRSPGETVNPLLYGAAKPRPHLSSIELQEGKIGLAGDPVKAEDSVHHPSPNPDQTVCDRLARLPQPGARACELPPDHVHHVVLLVVLLQSQVLVLETVSTASHYRTQVHPPETLGTTCTHRDTV